MKLDFAELVKQLRKDKYYCKVVNHRKEGYKHCFFEDDAICGMFCTPSEQCYSVLNNRVAVEIKELFDKWTKAPLVMKLPLEYEELLKHIAFLKTDEGFTYSNRWFYIDDNPKIPREIDYEDDL